MVDNHLFLPGVAGEYVSAPDITAYDLNDTFELVAFVALDDWTPSPVVNIVGQFVGSGGQRSYRLGINGAGFIQLEASNTGTAIEGATSSVGTGFTDGTAHWVGVSFDGGEIKFFTGGTDINSPSWVQLGITRTLSTVTSVHNSTQPLEIGSINGGGVFNLAGGVYRVILYSDLTRSTTEFDADFTKLTVADLEAGSFTEDSSEAATVTLNGDAWAYVRPYNRVDILQSAELLLMANDGNKFFSPKWADRSGNNHHAQNGSAAGADTNDALGKTHDGTQYVFLPGTSGNYLSTPDAAALDQTGDIWVAGRFALDDWTPATDMTLVAKWEDTSDQRSYRLMVDTTGVLRLGWSTDGTAANVVEEDSTVAPIVTDGDPLWVAGTVDVSVGTVKFYTGGAGTTPVWTQLGSTVTGSGATSIHSGTAVLEVGTDNTGTAQFLTGDIFNAQLEDGYDEGVGTLQFDVVLADATQPFATFTERSSNAATVTFNRSASGLVSTVIDRDQWLYTTDDFQEIADDAALDFAGGDDLSGIVVFRTNTVAAGDHVLLAKKDNLTTSLGYALVRSTATGKFIIADGTLDDDDTAATIAIHILASVAGVRDAAGDDDLEAFLDGTGSGSPTTDSTTTTLANALPVRIGATSNAAANFFEGSIMAVALWPAGTALTGAQVQEAHDLLTTGPSSFPPVRRDKALAGIIQR